MQLSSSAFQPGGDLPERFGHNAGNLSPPLTITDVPGAAQSLVLIMDDPDAPTANFVHWVLFNIPPRTGVILENEPPPEATAGRNGFGDVGYGGPRPPSGTHRYFLHLHALDRRLDLPAGATRIAVENAMRGHILASASLLGCYSALATHSR